MRTHRSIRSKASSLPEVVDCRARRDEAPGYAELVAGDLEWDNPYAWGIEYQAVYEEGVVDSCLKLRAMRGTTEAEAIYRLQKLLAGFGVLRILLWHVRPPMAVGRIEDLRRLNEALERTKRIHESAIRNCPILGAGRGPQSAIAGPVRRGPGPLGRDSDEPAGGAAAQLARLVHCEGSGRGVPARLLCV